MSIKWAVVIYVVLRLAPHFISNQTINGDKSVCACLGNEQYELLISLTQ